MISLSLFRSSSTLWKRKRSPQAERTRYEVTSSDSQSTGRDPRNNSFSHVVFFPSVYHFTSDVHVELQSLAHLQVIVVSRNLVASEETAKDFHQTLKTYAEEARAQPGNLQ